MSTTLLVPPLSTSLVLGVSAGSAPLLGVAKVPRKCVFLPLFRVFLCLCVVLCPGFFHCKREDCLTIGLIMGLFHLGWNQKS